MALLAEELVEEWLNRQGYFTIRGIRCGVHEIDLLAVLASSGSITERRQIEVQSSVRPVSYMTPLSAETRKRTGRAAGSAKERSDDELRAGIAEWIEKKYNHPNKRRIREQLCPGPWTRELVVNVLKHERELELLREAGVHVMRLSTIVRELKSDGLMLTGCCGSDLSDLVGMAESDA